MKKEVTAGRDFGGLNVTRGGGGYFLALVSVLIFLWILNFADKFNSFDLESKGVKGVKKNSGAKCGPI